MSEIREAADQVASEHRLTIRAAAGRPRRDPFVFHCSCGFVCPTFAEWTRHLPDPGGPVMWDPILVRWWDRTREEEQ